MERLMRNNKSNFQRLIRHNSVPVTSKTRRATVALYQPPALRNFYNNQQQGRNQQKFQGMNNNGRQCNKMTRPQCNPRMGNCSRRNPYYIAPKLTNQQETAKTETASNTSTVHKYEVAINLRTTDDEAND
jgi:hypothetical protein